MRRSFMRGMNSSFRLLKVVFVACSIVFLVGFIFTVGTEGKTSRKISSPDGEVAVSFLLQSGIPRYRVEYRGNEIIRPSRLGFWIHKGPSLDDGFRLIDRDAGEFDGSWKPVWGEKSTVRNHYRELRIGLQEENSPRRKMNLIFRVFDGGIGFRYELPVQDNLEYVEITSEQTRFCFNGDHTVWWIPADYDSYEHLYTESLLSEVKGVNTPVTMRTGDGVYISIHEADLTDYAGMTLISSPGDSIAMEADLVPWPDGIKVKRNTPLVTPWRTIQIADRPGALIESDLILNLNRPNQLEDTSWIKPMKYMGIWWGMHTGKYTWFAGASHGATTVNAKRYIDFASANGIPGLLIEGWNRGWENWGRKDAFDFLQSYPDFDLPEVVDYASRRGVSIIGHHETGGDVTGYEKQIDRAFRLYQKLGINAVKTGYAGSIYPRGQHHHGQWMARHYRMVVKKAARYHLMIDAHEPIKPTGTGRTYPNMMTREGVRGMEYNAWSEGNPPIHTTILPFTRMLAGPADYTPGIFDLEFDRYREDNRVYSTVTNQLALYVVLYSPLQMVADLPENYIDQPAFEFIRRVPSDWDETRAIHAAIGDYVTIARRNGRNWFVGSITDENARFLSLSFSFLEEGVKYRARVFADTPQSHWRDNPCKIEIYDLLIDSAYQLPVKMAPGGGMAIMIEPFEEEVGDE